MPGNDAEELLPVTAFEKVIKTTITQAASPVTREDMGTAYKGCDPRRHGHAEFAPVTHRNAAVAGGAQITADMGADAVDQESVK